MPAEARASEGPIFSQRGNRFDAGEPYLMLVRAMLPRSGFHGWALQPCSSEIRQAPEAGINADCVPTVPEGYHTAEAAVLQESEFEM